MWVVLHPLEQGAILKEFLLLVSQDGGPFLGGQNVVKNGLVLLLVQIRQEPERIVLLLVLALSEDSLNHRHVLTLRASVVIKMRVKRLDDVKSVVIRVVAYDREPLHVAIALIELSEFLVKDAIAPPCNTVVMVLI